MAHRVLAETAVSISELKKNPMATVAAGEGLPVVVLNRIADARLADGQEPARVSIDAL